MELDQSFPCFPIPVSIYNFGKDAHELNIKVANDILDEMDYFNNRGVIRSNLGGWHSDDMSHHGSFKMLIEHIEACLDAYCETHGFYGDLKIDHIWGNVNKAQNYNLMHHHGLSTLTGVYYPVQCVQDNKLMFNYKERVSLEAGIGNEKEEGGALILQDPNFGLKTTLVIKEQSPFTLSHYHLYPVAGVLLIFPPYLLHTVTPHYEDDYDRISVSFSCEYPADAPRNNPNGSNGNN